MFSMFKKSSTEQEVVLPSLNEEQLAQVAGGYDSSYSWQNNGDQQMWNQQHHHHKHHKKHWNTWNSSSSSHNWNKSSSDHNWNSNYQQKW